MQEETPDKSQIRRVVIVGGGTAGWMTAAALSTVLKAELCSIELVESDAIGIVGVGEATIPAIHDFNRKIGLDEQEMMRNTYATFKLGIEFVNWAKIGDAYVHPFGSYGFDINGVAFHQYWLDQRAQGDQTPFDEYSIAIVAAKLGKFALPQTDARSILSYYSYAFHFDAALYAKHLRQVAEARGVSRTEGRIVDVSLRGEDGFIESVILESGLSIEGDLFVDCSGFRALMIEKALGTDYESWAQWLPCDRAVAIPSENPDSLDPYTRATAHSAGWQWRIPLQHRTGNGHVYCSDFMGDDEAQSIAIKNLERSPIGEPRLIKFVAGKRKQMWRKNCVAIGLSGGFLEPLESTSIFLIQAAVTDLANLMPAPGGGPPDPRLAAEFNRLFAIHYDRTRDFLVLHYTANARHGEPLWDHVRNMALPDSLAHKIALFRSSGRAPDYKLGLFSRDSWLAVLMGQGILPQAHDRLADRAPLDEVAERLADLRERIATNAAALPAHAEFIHGYCSAPRGSADDKAVVA
ncbi:MAG: tryptophan 7-halogenase [Proteobacteria bacterium]|nr:tryptophan 7-halogenase [Pseudomonadota bacterium]